MMFALALCAVAGCGGNSMTGTVKGVSMNAAEAIFAVLSDAGPGQGMFILVSDKTGLCERMKANKPPKDATLLAMLLGVIDAAGHGQALVKGTYNVKPVSPGVSGNVAISQFSKLDSTCNSTLGDTPPTGTSGTVSLSNFEAKDGGSASGNFDMNFDSDHVTGTFSASYCDVTTLSTGKSPTCE